MPDFFFRDDWQVTWKEYITDLSATLDKKPRGSLPLTLLRPRAPPPISNRT